MLDRTQLEVSALQQSALFSGFVLEQVRQLMNFSQCRWLKSGEQLFAAGEPCGHLHCLVSGSIKLYLTGPRQQQKIVQIVEPGETFAEAAMFSGQGYPATAVAVGESQIIAINAYAFSRYLRDHPELNWKLLSLVSRKLHDQFGEIRSICMMSAEQKVANYLLCNSDPEVVHGPVDHVPVRRTELASMLGITPETLCRVLASFRKRGWVDTHERAIVVHDSPALQEIIEPQAQPHAAARGVSKANAVCSAAG